jgi:hypothetical protein
MTAKIYCCAEMHSKCFGKCRNFANEIDAINGHLTCFKDSLEIQNWKLWAEKERFSIHKLFEINGRSFVYPGAGSIESVASVLQLHHGFVFQIN